EHADTPPQDGLQEPDTGATRTATLESSMETAHDTAVAEHDAKHLTITVTVNHRPVTFHQHRATGLEIKERAIAEHVPIQADFALFEDKGHGHLAQITDAEEVTLHQGQKFRAVAPDDNS